MLSKEYWGKGSGVESASKVIQFGFENMELNKIEAPCMVENAQSQKVLQKLGMRLEGVSKERCLSKGSFGIWRHILF
ncbi:GNAT family protein [Cytobacillus sp. S13-E01]|nr:GNAT family protein [Cytobacillus sp. S13-E01]MDF0725674.1 GNAT family protein [Cytobacillus sp. S13-E01]